MNHTHFNTIHSTQVYLRDNLVDLLDHSSDVLITACEQTMGIGRKGSQWDSYSNSLAMSFTIRPNSIPTMTPIEIGILTSLFLKKEYDIDIMLKWPNDLMTNEGKKCGGIIAQYINTEVVIAGLGLNLGETHTQNAPSHYKHGLGKVSATMTLTPEDQKNIPAKIYNFILQNRIQTSEDLQNHFKNVCIHMDKTVLIDDDGSEHNGIFKGIGHNGEALVEVQGNVTPFLASSLKIID